jgi:plasmid stabilization system protein ParE
MTPVIWTPAALQDVARLHDAFLSPKNREAARRAIGAIRQSARSLATHPELGRPVEEMPPEFRERFVPFGRSGYVVLYRYDGSRVAILAVRHSREAGY